MKGFIVSVQKPTAIKELQGNPGRRPLPKKEPKPKVGKLSCPRWMNGKAKWAFNELGLQLEKMKVLTHADRKALELLCDSYAEFREAREYVLSNGFTYETTTPAGDKMVRPYPHVTIYQNAWRRCSDMLKQFGLTPSSRAGVEMIDEKEEDPVEGFLKRVK